MIEKSEYLGDSVYAGIERGMVLLTTSDHDPRMADNQVYLEPQVLVALIEYAKKHGIIK